jgi:capsular exopolysaccharide synthesis family protein
MNYLLKALRKTKDGDGDVDPVTAEYLRQPTKPSKSLEFIPVEKAEIVPASRIVVWDNPQALPADRYRMLRMQLERLRGDGKLKTVLLTSPSPEDGKSTVALNLASILAKHGKRQVLLLEADLRCPSLTRRLGLKSWPGLTECLSNRLDVMAAVRQIDPLQFYLLPAGAPVEDPAELLHSDALTHCVEAVSKEFDWVLIDAPPTTPIPDALILKTRADACLLVARAGKTRREQLEESVQLLGPKSVLGIVLNGMEGLEKRYSGYYENYYGQAQIGTVDADSEPAK